jgi:DNA-binding Lrp family transcriptional regulator
MDELDEKLLAALAQNSSTSTSQLARRFKVARSTVQARIERLERTGIIAGYTIKLGQALTLKRIRATVLLQVEPRATPQILQRLKALPEVERVSTTTGRIDLILQLAAETAQALDETLDQIGALPGVADTESLIHLSTKIDRAV